MRMQLGERGGVGVNIRELELRFVQRLNYLQNIQHPGVLFQPAALRAAGGCASGQQHAHLFPAA